MSEEIIENEASDQTNKLKEENKMLKDKLERANQQIKLLAVNLLHSEKNKY